MEKVIKILTLFFNFYVENIEEIYNGEISNVYLFISQKEKYILKVKKDNINNEYLFQDKAYNLNLAPKIFKRVIIKEIEYIVMEYVSGVTLSKFIYEEKYKNVDELFEIISKILDMLNILHKEGICHGDIHVANVIIENKHKIYLIDFEYAHKIGNKIEIDYDNISFLHSVAYINEDAGIVAKKLGYRYNEHQRVFREYFKIHEK